MTTDTALKTEAKITLTVPVTVAGADGKTAERSTLTMRRPKLRHTKRLAALIGEDILSVLVGGEDAKADEPKKEDDRALVVAVVGKLLTRERLDEATAILADLCGEDVAVIDDLDPLDLVRIAEALGDFFPKLQSALASLSQRT